MNGSLNTFKMGSDPSLQLIIIVSAIMHILAIALINDPFGVNEKREDNYFVKLVMPSQTDQSPKADLIKKTPEREKTAVTAKPSVKEPQVKKQVEVKSPPVVMRPIEKKSIKTRYADTKQLPKTVIPLARSKNASSSSGSIKRHEQSIKTIDSSAAVTMDRTAVSPEFAEKNDVAKQGKMIMGKGVSEKTAFKSVSKGVREQSFAYPEDVHNEDQLIEQKNRPLENSNVPVEKMPMEQILAAAGESEEIYENASVISRAEDAIKNEPYHESPKDTSEAYSETDFGSNPGLPSVHGDESMPAISRSASHNMPVIKKVRYQPLAEQLISENKPDQQQSSEMSIKGVPLDELNACSNALDERTLKKKILNVVGNKRGCYSQDVGEYLFMGTVRFASFDMKILPSSGRKLSNRCEELRNAFQCLTMK